MNTQIPVNPAILRWAREGTGLSCEDVADKLKLKSISANTVSLWESGEGSPSYAQLEKLAYEIYKRPLAVFFFPEPPKEETPKQSFRTLPEQEIERLPTRILYLVRQAKAMQINLGELYDDVNPAQNQIVRDLKYFPNTPISKMVADVRKYLNVQLVDQFQWKNPETAFKAWRKALEDCGVFVFKEAFKDKTFSGFCLYHDRFPIIYVNNSQPPTRQIFTLFHELAHLLLGTGGIDAPLEGYVKYLHGDDKWIEVSCNSFAGAFLVPDEDFDSRIKAFSIFDDAVSGFADMYCVSREVILRKLLDRNLINDQYYKGKVEQWKKEASGKKGRGGNYYLTKRAYLGVRYLDLVFSRLYQKRITVEQVADYLDVKVKYVPGIEGMLYQEEVAA
jgi:Zn-dependent peptidase ImmA (M78 family)